MSNQDQPRREEELIREIESKFFNCRSIWGSLKVCIGDIVEIYPRGFTRMVAVRGKVIGLSDSAITLETPENNVAVRYTEIRMIRKLHQQ